MTKLQQLRVLLIAYASALPILPGYVFGLLYYRFMDGMGVARRHLHDVDDKAIDVLRDIGELQ